jgi:hypothetical protein
LQFVTDLQGLRRAAAVGSLPRSGMRLQGLSRISVKRIDLLTEIGRRAALRGLARRATLRAGDDPATQRPPEAASGGDRIATPELVPAGPAGPPERSIRRHVR